MSSMLGRGRRGVIGRSADPRGSGGSNCVHPRIHPRLDDAAPAAHYGVAVILSDLWSDDPRARRPRLVLGVVVLVGIVAGCTPPEHGGGRALFLASLLLAGGAWIVWSLVRPGVVPALLAPAAICVAAALAVGSGGHTRAAFVLAFVAVFATAERQPPAKALLLTGGALIALLAAVGASSGAGEDYALAVAVPAIGFLGGWARREQIQRAEQAELLLAETQRAHEEQARAAALDERVRLAREIHDVLAHSLSALSVQLEIAQALLAEKRDPAGALAQIERSQRLVVAGIDETRQAVATLRGDTQPLASFVSRLVDDYRADYAARADYSLQGSPQQLAPDADLACRRVAQEALTNVRKHAAGAGIAVALAYGGADVLLTVWNSPGAAAASSVPEGGGYGIAGMRERAALVGGSFSAGPYA